ncbi:phage holin family protein [Brevibacterium yomogidense]|uniref:phage holin family protein n=1 Tax=Brevibacterium yomogidense TaxID=946573 RepID=UPI0018DFF62A|nr:phage holin family protein [Brevibacterium yomogidense]
MSHDPTRRSPGGASPRSAASEAQAEVRAEHQSLGDLFSSLSQNTSTLIQQEIALAKAEATQTARRAGTGAGLLTGAGLAAVFVLLFLSTALWVALGSLIGDGWSGLVVAALWAVIAAVLAVVGRKRLKEATGLPETLDTAKEIPPTVNPLKETP